MKDADFLERLAELDRDLPVTDPQIAALSDLLASEAVATTLLDDDRDEPLSAQIPTSRGLVGAVAAVVVLVAAGATAAAYIFQRDLAAILAAWQQVP